MEPGAGVKARGRMAAPMAPGPYAWSFQGAQTLVDIVRDRQRVLRHGIPRKEADSVGDVAAAVLRDNAGPVLAAGGGHFRAMWTVDLGKAFAGAMRVLPRDYLKGLVARILDESIRRDRVPTCFTPRGSHDAPWPRADNLPWLLHMADLLGPSFVGARERDLRRVYDAWARTCLDPATGLVRTRVRGDWMDTVPRPSSTYNNLCALHAHALARRWGFPDAEAAEVRATAALLLERWYEGFLRDHAEAGAYLSADANVPAFYFGVLPERERREMARTLEESALVRPLPLRTRTEPLPTRGLPPLTRLVPEYHAAIWPHLGFMHAIGLKRLGLPWRHHADALERVVREHGTFLETLDPQGRPLLTRHLTTEYHFTMAAGLYLELTEDG